MAMSRSRKAALWIVGILVAFALVFAVCVAVFYAAFNNEPRVKDNSVLVLNVGGSLPDYVAEDPVNRFLGRDERSLSSLLLQLRKAKADKRVKGVLLDVDIITSGWAKAEVLRDAVADFRASGKPVYAYMEYGANKEYYVATACDKVYVAPIGELAIVGLAADVVSLGGSLEKLGIKADFYQIGRYKTAPEQYTRKSMSDANREVLNSVLDDFFNRFVSDVASARHKSDADVRAAIYNAPLRAEEAKQQGLIDDTKYRDEVEGEMKKRLGYREDDKLNVVGESQYRRVDPESLNLNQGDKIAVVYASGAIMSGRSSGGGALGEQTVGSDTVSKAIKDAGDDKSVKAIVLRVDSPGGTTFASDIIWHAVENAKARKPVVVSMGDVGASGGYYISCGAQKIVAEPSTITGSIGVFAGKPVMKGFYDWIGLNDEYISRGKFAAIYRETEPFTDDERKKFQSMLDDFYNKDFVPKVAQGRKRDAEYINSIGQGHVWTGAQAKQNGLIDEFGGLDRAVEIAKQLANIPADKSVRRVVFPTPRTFLQQLFGGGDDEVTVEADRPNAALQSLPEDVRRRLAYLSLFEHISRGETMAMLPYDLRIK
ncbi:MAG: signal peptide peptidase SppA [Acidobacteriota bacterium]|nr:signal peptide peptidase SppA [Acidobacteriota bacterium]